MLGEKTPEETARAWADFLSTSQKKRLKEQGEAND